MHSQTATHASLLDRLRTAHDEDAWIEFDERYGRLIRAFARRRGLQPVDCEDVAQEVMLSVSKALPGFQYDPSRGKFRGYLKTVTIRAILRNGRQNGREMALGTLEEMTRCAEQDREIEEAWEREWQRYHLRRAMRTLDSEFSEIDREAFQRYAVDGREAAQTARELDLPVNRVYQAKSRILKRLEQFIALQVEEEG